MNRAEKLIARLREQAQSQSQHPDDKRTWSAAADALQEAMTFVRSIAALNDGLSDGDRALVFTKLTSRARRILSRWEAP